MEDQLPSDLPALNGSVSMHHLECLYQMYQTLQESDSEGLFCPTTWDRVMCWPRTPAGTLAQLPCFEEFNGIKYDSSDNATRLCNINGTWQNYTDYAKCRERKAAIPESGSELTFMVYLVGYSLSLTVLCVAVWIFLYFKDLRCLRNTIHTNLMFTYILNDFMWILFMLLQMYAQTGASSCVILSIILHYFHMTNIYWMFVEGLYLYMLVVETFSGENIKLRVYVVIGWGAPLVIVVVWGIVKVFAVGISTENSQTEGTAADEWLICSSMTPHMYDWIYKVPALLVLAVNFVFLVMIMWVLITKLRSANSLETQQYRKATKALLVLCPLLGVNYILTLLGPGEGSPDMGAKVWSAMRALLLSTQGLTVALFYCFLNTEVQNTVRHHVDRWRTERSLAGGRRYRYSKDWSPRSRTESLRLYSQPTNNYRKRESTVSETTTTTLVGNLNGARFSNGSNAAAAVRASSISPYLMAENAV